MVISGTFLALLVLVRPYKRVDDLQLAALCNLLLTCTFALGVVIKVCVDDEDLCPQLVGIDSARGAAVIVVVLMASLLMVALLAAVFHVVSAASPPRMTLVATHRPPILDLPRDCTFHAFLSHTWATGQVRTDAGGGFPTRKCSGACSA